MFGLFGTRAPARVETDQVVPLHYFDDAPLWRAFILYSLFIFDHVLDAERLKSSAERLVDKEGWRKLGARLRYNKDGTLEYQIPPTFTPERPAISYSHIKFDSRASEHPLACRIPTASARPAVVCDPEEFLNLMRPIDGPTKLANYTNSDIPQLGLHIVSFDDKTLVTIYWPHTLMDAMGKHDFLRAWSLIVQGREGEVKIPHGADRDPFDKLGKRPGELHKLTAHRMGIFGMLGYGLGQVLNLLWKKQETRMVCIPSSFLTKLRQEAVDKLAASQEVGKEMPFLSEGDVLCAWWTRLATAHLPSSSDQTIVLSNAYDIRKVLAPDLIPEDKTYVSNAICLLPVLLSLGDIRDRPLCYTAFQIRKAIQELGTKEQVEAFHAMVREGSAKLPPFFGDRTMHMITYSNWTKADLFEVVDFSPAIMHSADGSGVRKNEKMTKPVYIQTNPFGLTLPNAFPIIGKDRDGNYWLSGYLNAGQWAEIEMLLEKEVLGEA